MTIIFNGIPTSFTAGFNVEQKLSFDDDLKMYFIESESTLSLGKEAYEIIYEDMISGNYCQSYPVQIECKGEIIFDGVVRVLDTAIISKKCTVDVSLIYDNDYLTVSENSGVEIQVSQNTVLNTSCCDDEDVGLPTQKTLQIDYCDGQKQLKAWRIVDLIEHWIRANGLNYSLNFINDFVEQLYVTRAAFFVNEFDILKYSLDDLIEFITSYIPIVFELENGKINIYSYDEYYTDDVQVLDTSDVKLVAINANKEQAYTSIKFGGDDAPDQIRGDCGSFPTFGFNGWSEITYNKQGCSNGEELDISHGHISDNNSIKNMVDIDEKYNDFVVMYLVELGGDVVQFPQTVYNQQLLNFETLKRYSNYLSTNGFCLEDVLPVGQAYISPNKTQQGNRLFLAVEDEIFNVRPESEYGGGWLPFYFNPPMEFPALFGELIEQDFVSNTNLPRRYITFTPTETRCYCIEYQLTVDYKAQKLGAPLNYLPYPTLHVAIFEDIDDFIFSDFIAGNLNEIWKDAIDFEDVQGLDSVVENDPLGGQITYLNDRVIRTSACVTLEAGTTYIIDQTWLEQDAGVNNSSLDIKEESYITITPCEADNDCEPSLDFSLEGRLCFDDWKNLDPRKQICVEYCGDQYCGNITEIERSLRGGSFSGNMIGRRKEPCVNFEDVDFTYFDLSPSLSIQSDGRILIPPATTLRLSLNYGNLNFCEPCNNLEFLMLYEDVNGNPISARVTTYQNNAPTVITNAQGNGLPNLDPSNPVQDLDYLFSATTDGSSIYVRLDKFICS